MITPYMKFNQNLRGRVLFQDFLVDLSWNSFLGTRLSQDSKQIWMSDDSKDVLYSHIIIYFRITYLRIQTKRSMCYRLNLPTRTKYPTKNILGSRGL